MDPLWHQHGPDRPSRRRASADAAKVGGAQRVWLSPRAEQPLERLTPQQRAILDDAAMFGRTWQRVDQTAGKGGTWFAVPRPGRPLPTVTRLTLALHRAPVRGFRTRLDGLRCNHIEGRSV